jgi:hypothetical protein
MPYPKIDLKKVHTYPIAQRRNLVTLNDLIHPLTPLRRLKSRTA